jgi:hypothetical protein
LGLYLLSILSSLVVPVVQADRTVVLAVVVLAAI